MRRRAGAVVCAAILIASTVSPAVAQVPAVLAVPEDAVALDGAALRAARRDLLIRLSDLRQRVQTHNAQCSSVDRSSPDGAACATRHEELEKLRLGYVRDAERFNGRVRRVRRDTKQCSVFERQWSSRLSDWVCAGAANVPPDTPVRVLIERMSGDVQLFTFKDEQRVPVPPVGQGRPVLVSEIRTGLNSRAQLRLSDDTVFSLYQNSEIVFDELVHGSPSTALDMSLRLAKGVIRFVDRKIAARPIVRQPQGVTFVQGTDFVVEALGDERLAITLIRGAIEFKPWGDGPAVTLKAGERIEVDANGLVTRRTNEPPAVLEERWR